GEITPDGLHGQNVWAPDPVHWEADAVVLVTQRQPRDELYHELRADPDRLVREGIDSVYRIGDCLAPRTIAENVFDGHRLPRGVDTADPATPPPPIPPLPHPEPSPRGRSRRRLAHQPHDEPEERHGADHHSHPQVLGARRTGRARADPARGHHL